VFSFEDYLNQKVMTPLQVEIIRGSILTQESIIIAGGPGTGKTTFANTLLAEMFRLGSPHQRFILIEDIKELHCPAPNKVPMKTSDLIDHEHLLKVTLRKSPNKIIVGECRGKEMMMLLKAWNTGARGGLATIHANSAESALLRIYDMAVESGVVPSPYLICESINLIIALDFTNGNQRQVKEIVQVLGYKEGKYVLNYC
jgi:type IV secretion system protein VirB11